MDLFLRFLAGGLVVSTFAILGDVLKPKSFGGLAGAAPSVALATISITVMKAGRDYAALEARWMVVGALAFLVYAYTVAQLLRRRKWPALRAAGVCLVAWFAVAGGLWYVVKS